MIIINWIVFSIWAMLVVYAYKFVFKNFDDVNMKALLLALPTVALIIFAIVFVFNRGSSVAQLSSSTKLWSLWFNHYFKLVIGNTINLIITMILLFISIIKKRPKRVIFFNIQLFSITLLTLYHVLPRMPDA